MYLGIDLGTSEVKVAIVDGGGDAQRVIAVGRAGLEVARPHPAWSEQDPASWIRATEAAIAELRAAHAAELAAVTGIGLSGQMHGAVLLDAKGRVLRPAILWNDTRAAAECAVLEARVPASGGEVGAALGAARLGQLATDPRATVAAVCPPPPIVEIAEPVAAWQPALAARLARFRALYPALRPLFRSDRESPP
jgi:sugar (pentulose or hexulose) kinase